MSRNILKSVQQDFVFDVVEEIINSTGRTVSFISVTYRPCTVCSGSDPLCSACSGTNREEVTEQRDVMAVVRWKSAEERFMERSGQYFVGDVVLVVLNKDNIHEFLRSCKVAIVDGIRCEIVSFNFEGIYQNRINITLVQADGNRRIG